MVYNASRDPFLFKILGLIGAGMFCTALSIPGYLHADEQTKWGGLTLDYPASARKLPLSLMGAGMLFLAWKKEGDRQEYKHHYRLWFAQQQRLQMIRQAAELQGYEQVAQIEAAEKHFPKIAPYLDADYQEVPPTQAQPQLQQPMQPQQPMQYAQAPEQKFSATGPTVAPVEQHNPTAYLQNFLEYPALMFGGMGAGKSWTARYIAMLKAQAGQKVVALDPHAASHEWKGIQHIGAGMDYKAIAEFLEWYIAEITRRYQAFNKSGLSEEEWQQSMRQQGDVVSVICEEMTNWADRIPGSLSPNFVKASWSDSRKILMPPLFVAHNRTMACLGDAKGLAALRDASLLELELIPTIHPQSRKPVSSGKGKLKLPGHPDWLDVELPRVDLKLTDFTPWTLTQTPISFGKEQPALDTPKPQPKPSVTQSDFRSQVVNFLKDCWQAEDNNSGNGDAIVILPAHLQKIVDFSRKNGWITARMVKQNIRAFVDHSPDDIREVFRSIESMGVGRCRGEGDRLEFMA
ncbi:MAG: hypothetical protein ACKO24_08055 [Leptolyngbyaceae cyanobacterium]